MVICPKAIYPLHRSCNWTWAKMFCCEQQLSHGLVLTNTDIPASVWFLHSVWTQFWSGGTCGCWRWACPRVGGDGTAVCGVCMVYVRLNCCTLHIVGVIIPSFTLTNIFNTIPSIGSHGAGLPGNCMPHSTAQCPPAMRDQMRWGQWNWEGSGIKGSY